MVSSVSFIIFSIIHVIGRVIVCGARRSSAVIVGGSQDHNLWYKRTKKAQNTNELHIRLRSQFLLLSNSHWETSHRSMSSSSSPTATCVSSLKGTPLRQQVCLWLSNHVSPTKHSIKAPKGLFTKCAAKFTQYKAAGIRTLWRKHKMAILHPDKTALNIRRKKGSGLKRKYSVAEVQSKVKAVKFRYRQNMQTLAKHTGIPKTTISRLLKAGALVKSRNSIKPI